MILSLAIAFLLYKSRDSDYLRTIMTYFFSSLALYQGYIAFSILSRFEWAITRANTSQGWRLYLFITPLEIGLLWLLIYIIHLKRRVK